MEYSSRLKIFYIHGLYMDYIPLTKWDADPSVFNPHGQLFMVEVLQPICGFVFSGYRCITSNLFVKNVDVIDCFCMLLYAFAGYVITSDWMI